MFLCDLLDGLEGVPGSLYRAWVLEHEKPVKGSKRAGRLKLGWLGYDQSEMLLLNVANSVEAIRCVVTNRGGGKAKPEIVLPPGADDVNRKNHVDGRGLSLSQYAAQVQSLFGG